MPSNYGGAKRLWAENQRHKEEHEARIRERTQELKALNEALISEIEERNRIEAKLEEVRTNQTLRAIMSDLRPPTLPPFGLEKSIREHVENIRRIHWKWIRHRARALVCGPMSLLSGLLSRSFPINSQPDQSRQ